MPRGVYERKPRAAAPDIPGAPPQTQKPRKRKPRKPRAAATERFLPAVDADRRLVLVNDAEPQIFSEAQTLAIATLLFQHYEA